MKYLIMLALVASSLVAQVTLNETTTAATMTAAQTTAQLASTSNVLAGYLLYIVDTDGQPGELVAVTRVQGNTVTIQRGRGGYQVKHELSARVIIGPNASAFGNAPKVGGCAAGDTPFTPWVDVSSGITYTCTSGAWIATNQGGGGGGGGAGATSQLTDFAATGVGSSALAITCATGRCNAATGDTVTSFSGLSASCTLAAGSYTAYAYIDQASAALVVGASTIPTSCAGATAAGSITVYPAGAVPLWRATVTSGSISALIDDRAAYGVGKRVLVTGAGAPTRTETAAAVTLDFASAGGGSPGGSGSELQYRAGASTFGGIANTLIESGALRWNTGTMSAGGLVRFGSTVSSHNSMLSFNLAGSTDGWLVSWAGNLSRVTAGIDGIGRPHLRWNNAGGDSHNWGLFGIHFDTDPTVSTRVGKIVMQPAAGSALQLNTTGTKPTCAVGIRGSIWYGAGGGGVADILEVCRKDAADAYAWVALY